MAKEHQNLKAPYNFSESLSILNQQCPGIREDLTIGQYLKTEQVVLNPELIEYFKENPKLAYAVMQNTEISCKILASHNRFYDSFQDTKKKIAGEIFSNYLPLNLMAYTPLGVILWLGLTVGIPLFPIAVGLFTFAAIGLACAMVYDYKKNIKSAFEIQSTGSLHVIQDIAHQYENTIIKPNTCSGFLNFFKKPKAISSLEESNLEERLSPP